MAKALSRRVGTAAIQKVTSLLVVEAIEPLLPMWEALGMSRTVEVPHEGKIGFVILAGAGTEIMLQSRASLEDDAASVAKHAKGPLLYCDVDSLAKTRKAVEKETGVKVLIKERETPYGAREMWIVDRAGTVIGFAEHA
jgi:hypothetical protein